MFRILVTIPNFSQAAKPVLEALGAVTYAIPTQEKLAEALRDVAVAVVGLGLRIGKEEIDASPRLRIIATATTGLDHIDLDAAKARGIEVVSLRGENAFLDTITGTAELAWGLLISLIRNIPAAAESVRAGKWDREAFRGHSLYGKTLGIVGLGRLGSMMARFGEAFGMRVLFADPEVEADAFLQYEKVSFDDLLGSSDVISIHVHLSKETELMFGDDAFSKMKPNAVLVNTSRGKIVDEAALLAALEKGNLAGYAADVLAGELSFDPPSTVSTSDPLVEYAKTHDNVLLVPHIGGNTIESRQATDIFLAKILATRMLEAVVQ